MGDKFGWGRKKVVSYTCLIGFLGSLVFTTKAGLYLIDIVDHFVTNYALILGGIIECYVVGWLLKTKVLRTHINRSSSASAFKIGFWWDICIRFITPVVLLWILLRTLTGELKSNYGDYPLDSIILFGVDWLIIIVIVSVSLTFYPWKPELLKRHHTPEEDKLLV